jgi:hypothetical protein
MISASPDEVADHERRSGSSSAVTSTLMNSPHFAPWRPRAWAFGPRHAEVAQLVEHATENRGVGGSIPPLGTFSISSI